MLSRLSVGRLAARLRLTRDAEIGLAVLAITLNNCISRLGCVEGADDSARHAYICRGEAIRVSCCAEQFENDGPPLSTIVKGIELQKDKSQAQSQYSEAEANCGKDPSNLMLA